jgi:hypothetical protein
MLDLAGVLQLLPELSPNRSGSLAVATTYIVGFRTGCYSEDWCDGSTGRITTILHARGCMLEFIGSDRLAKECSEWPFRGWMWSQKLRTVIFNLSVTAVLLSAMMSSSIVGDQNGHYPVGEKFMSPDL